MKFEDYSIADQLKKNINILGFKRPTDIQFKSIPSILKREDVLAVAQTGTGKTAAFAIPILDILMKGKPSEKNEVRCIVMVPTRELAIQITEVFHKLSINTGINTVCLYGGVGQDRQIVKIEEGIDILIATPGRMFDFIAQGHLNLGKIEILVLDEADHMLDLGFIKDIKDIKRKIPKKHQTLFFSATIDNEIKKIAYELIYSEAIRIQISPKDPVSKNVKHSVIFVEMDDKRFFLERLLKEHPEEKVLVFVRTKVRAERVMKAMERINIKALTIHSDKEQDERIKVMNMYKSGEAKVLIATDVSARGIDIPNVQYVVNYDLPDQPENYVHRIGRTGRGKEKGTAFTFCSPEEKSLLHDIEKYTQNSINVTVVEKEDYLETLDFTDDHDSNWKQLLRQDAFDEKQKRKGKKKK